MAAPIALDPKDPTPLYAQLEHAIRVGIATRRLAPGDQLPTVRHIHDNLDLPAVRAGLGAHGALRTVRGRAVRREDHQRLLALDIRES